MKIFLSYRRDDTGGRAGRLFDTLVARYGSRNVFQDVNAVAPGVDFVEHVGTAIITSDVTLVVIGQNWLSSSDPDGGRRVDRPDDFVRREVGTALTAGKPVVPVLVDDARLPTPNDLPAELVSLTHRQAVTVRDASWHQDVDDLIRRLEGETRVPDRRRRWPIVAAGVAVMIALVVGFALLRTVNDDDDSSGNSTEPPDCPELDATWTNLDLADDPTTETVSPDGYVYDFSIERAGFLPSGDGGGLVVVHVGLANGGEPVDGTFDDDIYFGLGAISGLLVDGVSVDEVACFGTVRGDPEIEPTERATRAVGFESSDDPTNVDVVLEVLNGGAEVDVASGG